MSTVYIWETGRHNPASVWERNEAGGSVSSRQYVKSLF